MNVLVKWSSLQKSLIKFTPKKFYEIDPKLLFDSLVWKGQSGFENFISNIDIFNEIQFLQRISRKSVRSLQTSHWQIL